MSYWKPYAENQKSASNEKRLSDDTTKTKYHRWMAASASGTKREILEETDPHKNPINHVQKTY